MSVIGNTALRLDDEQGMLLDYARSFCADRGGIAAARTFLESELDYPPELWSDIVAMGWTGIGLTEEHGGSGLGIGAAVPVLESMGRALMGTPLMSSLLAAQLLQRSGDPAAGDLLGAIAAGEAACVAELECGDWGASRCGTYLDEQGLVHGEKLMVADAQSARWIVVVASAVAPPEQPAHKGAGQAGGEQVLAVVDARALAGDALRPCVLMDYSHRAADLALAAVKPVLLVRGAGVAGALRDYRLLGALLVAAESTGATAACLDTIVDYLKTRKQFGKLIGSYQALKHPSVDILTAMDSARSFIYHAATVIDATPLGRDQEIACRMAKAQATEALKYAGDRAVQFHGGMGFTWDCDAQLFNRRAQWAQQQFGDAQMHRQALAALLLD